MINYRQIFNPEYNYIGLILIAIIALIIILVEKHTISSIYKLAESSLIAGTITLIATLLLNFVMSFIIIGNYKIFIEVITKNVISSLYFYSIILILISSIIIFMIKTTYKEEIY